MVIYGIDSCYDTGITIEYLSFVGQAEDHGQSGCFQQGVHSGWLRNGTQIVCEPSNCLTTERCSAYVAGSNRNVHRIIEFPCLLFLEIGNVKSRELKRTLQSQFDTYLTRLYA